MTSSATVPQTKAELRQEYCSLRECLPPEEAEAASEAVCEQLMTFDPLLEAATVMAYLAFRSEVELGRLFAQLPAIRWVLPRISGRRMEVHVYDPEHLVRHRFGMMEPAPQVAAVSPREIDVVLVPGVAFDRRGGRLGFGGGYYDRFLPATPACRVGISQASCFVDELPCDAHDARMDWVVTPKEMVHCSPWWRAS